MKHTFLLLFLAGVFVAKAQNDEINGLKKELAKAKTDLQKMLALTRIREYYGTYQINDSDKLYAEKVRLLGEESSDPVVKMEGFQGFGNFLLRNSEVANDTIRRKKAQEYFNKRLQLAIATKDHSSEGWAHFALSYSSLTDDQQLDEALMANNIALEEPGNDSLYIFSYLRLAIAQGAFRNYKQVYINLDKALVKAVAAENPRWLRSVYKYFRELYYALGDKDKEWEMIEKLTEQTKKYYSPRSRIEDLRSKGYFIRQQAIGSFNYKARLAGTQSENTYDKEKLEQAINYLTEAYHLLITTRVGMPYLDWSILLSNIYWTYFWMNQPEKIAEFLQSDSLLMGGWLRQSTQNYKRLNKGAAYYLNNQLDSAIFLFDSCINNNYRNTDLYHVYFLLLLKKGDTDGMIRLLESASVVYRNRDDNETRNALLCLDSLYQSKGNYPLAQACLKQYVRISDSLDKEELDKKISLLAISSQEKILGKQREKEQAAIHRRNSLQYLGITIGIVVVFILLAIMGLYRVSARTIRVLGFLSFLLFFEFIFLLCKKHLAPLTKEEPIRELMFMIALAAVLIPLHHWLEHKVFQFLTSNKMLGYKKFNWRRKSSQSQQDRQQAKEV